MGRKKKRYGKLGWDMYNPKKFRAEKKRRTIRDVKTLGCFYLLLSPLMIVGLIIALIEQACGVNIIPKQKHEVVKPSPTPSALHFK
jgi:hypothetical protein